MENIKNQLEQAGYDYAVAIATEAEIKNGAACGQLAIVSENDKK
jgi:adenine C2-methylase RlmN of 23S rRNA A2503 and tRNA A37